MGSYSIVLGNPRNEKPNPGFVPPASVKGYQPKRINSRPLPPTSGSNVTTQSEGRSLICKEMMPCGICAVLGKECPKGEEEKK